MNFQNMPTLPTRDTGERCPVCGEKLLIAQIGFGMEIPIICECERARVRNERAEVIARGREKICIARKKRAGLAHEQWLEFTFANIRPRAGQEQAYKRGRDFAANFKAIFASRESTKGIAVSGPVGCGKTMLIAAIANDIVERADIDDFTAECVGNGTIAPDESPVRMISTVDLMANIKRRYDTGGAQDYIEKYQNAWLTVLDDVGAEKPTDWSNERLFEIVDYRYAERLPLIITTNQTPDEMESRLGARIVDRLSVMCAQVTIKTGSQRGIK